jgi:hypothetical protein
MHSSKTKKALWAAASCLMAATSASAFSLGAPLVPDHDWTLFGYGLQAYKSTTVVLLGSHYLDVPVPIYIVTACALLPLGWACVLLLHGMLRER